MTKCCGNCSEVNALTILFIVVVRLSLPSLCQALHSSSMPPDPQNRYAELFLGAVPARFNTLARTELAEAWEEHTGLGEAAFEGLQYPFLPQDDRGPSPRDDVEAEEASDDECLGWEIHAVHDVTDGESVQVGHLSMRGTVEQGIAENSDEELENLD